MLRRKEILPIGMYHLNVRSSGWGRGCNESQCRLQIISIHKQLDRGTISLKHSEFVGKVQVPHGGTETMLCHARLS